MGEQTIELIALAWVTLVSLVEAPALTLLRMGGLNRMITASAIYALAVVPLLSIALQYEGIGMVNFFWNILSTLLMFAIGIFMFKEKVSNIQLVGIILSLLGLSLVVLSK
jgi:multidrug transporter EmrE-like cation transporter